MLELGTLLNPKFTRAAYAVSHPPFKVTAQRANSTRLQFNASAARKYGRMSPKGWELI